MFVLIGIRDFVLYLADIFWQFLWNTDAKRQ